MHHINLTCAHGIYVHSYLYSCTHTYACMSYTPLFVYSHTIMYLLMIHTPVKPQWQKHANPGPCKIPVEGKQSFTQWPKYLGLRGPSSALCWPEGLCSLTAERRQPCAGEAVAGHSAPSPGIECCFSAAGAAEQGPTLGQAHPHFRGKARC